MGVKESGLRNCIAEIKAQTNFTGYMPFTTGSSTILRETPYGYNHKRSCDSLYCTAEIFICDLISYISCFWLTVRNLVYICAIASVCNTNLAVPINSSRKFANAGGRNIYEYETFCNYRTCVKHHCALSWRGGGVATTFASFFWQSWAQKEATSCSLKGKFGGKWIPHMC